MYYEVIPEGKVGELTYEFDAAAAGSEVSSLVPGQVVLVPLGRQEVPGVVVKKVAQPDFKTRKILKVLYSTPLPRQLLVAVKFVAEYYMVAPGEAVGLVLPRGVQKQRRKAKTEHLFGFRDDGGRSDIFPSDTQLRAPLASEAVRPSLRSSGKMFGAPLNSQILLNPHQKKALRGLQEAPGATKLLFGITGSGKTNVYLEMAARALKRQKSTIVLVPEIALTGQLVQVFREVFGEVVTVIHSKQTEAERHQVFNSLLEANGARIVVGPRSALFAPLKDLGLIIIDEAHEGTYTQENTPKYSALRVASVMARELGIDCVLGSATPTVADFYLAERQGAVVELTEKAKTSAVKPEMKVIDFKDRGNFSKNRYFSNALLAAIGRNLEQGWQTLIFHNRRGSATMTVCDNCGEEILCPNCFLPLTLHADEFVLQCHTCGFSTPVPAGCPNCGAAGLIHKGFGTKLLEAELKKLFPKARVRRFDADNKKGEGMEAVYTEVREGGVDILVGTQTLAKGLDLPRLATVGVAAADAGLALPDFMAEERVFQLLTQVMGRVGRGHLNTAEVFVQTYRPEHPVIKFALAEDYLGFYKCSVARRRAAGFPPFRFVAKAELTMKTEALVVQRVREAALKLGADQRLIVSPPCPAFHERTSRGYTWQIIVRARSRKVLVEALAGLGAKFRVTLDPVGLL